MYFEIIRKESTPSMLKGAESGPMFVETFGQRACLSYQVALGEQRRASRWAAVKSDKERSTEETSTAMNSRISEASTAEGGKRTGRQTPGERSGRTKDFNTSLLSWKRRRRAWKLGNYDDMARAVLKAENRQKHKFDLDGSPDTKPNHSRPRK